jgi:hypothetical protein
MTTAVDEKKKTDVEASNATTWKQMQGLVLTI